MRYPFKAPIAASESFLGDDATGATGMTDYLKIRRQRTTYKDGKYYGANTDFLPDSSASKTQHRSTVYLSIPGGINAQYQPVYRQVNLGVGGQAAIDALNSGATSDDLAASIRQAASAIRPEFISSALAQGANAISGFFGVQGNLDANSLQGLTTGKVFNPYTEQLFSQMNFRNHSFSFKMLARNYREAREIKNIITYLKVGSHPKVQSGDGTGNDGFFTDDGGLNKVGEQSKADGAPDKANDFQKEANTKIDDIGKQYNAGRFFEIPDHYDLDYVRMQPENISTVSDVNASISTTQTLHYRMQACVCSGININYTPDNQYTSFKSVNGSMIQVPAINLNIQFTEVKLLDQKDIINGF